MTAVGSEPTQLALVELESTPLDHSGKLSCVAKDFFFCIHAGIEVGISKCQAEDQSRGVICAQVSGLMWMTSGRVKHIGKFGGFQTKTSQASVEKW